MDREDMNYISNLEDAVREKWGEIAADNPMKHFDEEDREQYKEEVERINKKFFKSRRESADKKDIGDSVKIDEEFFVGREGNDICEVCKRYSFKSKDDLYLKQYGSCKECYIEYIEGRENRWENGWRPDNEDR